jgi:4-hydroxy-4-methyl-2-oxoglutarate aldolase
MNTSSQLSDQDLELLRQHDTPTICNVIELFNFRLRNKGYMDRSIESAFPEMPPMVGYASTATFRSAALSEGDVYGSLVNQVASFSEIGSPPVIVFQDLDHPVVAATFGELMCTTYKRFGAAGLITSGAGRDMDQVRAIDFPVFTNGVICAHGYCHTPTIQVTVEVGGLIVKPGDLLHGDCNGVTSIHHEIASEVAQLCGPFMDAESVLLDYLNGNDLTPKGLAEAQAASRSMIDKLAKQVAK